MKKVPLMSFLLQLIAKEANCEPDEICNFELQLCDTQPSAVAGAIKEFIFSGQLDNLCMPFCSLKVCLTIPRILSFIYFQFYNVESFLFLINYYLFSLFK